MTTAKITQMNNIAEWKTNLTVFCASFVLLLPFFFINFRLLAFNTLPFDDYYSFILNIDGKLNDFQFCSPYGYRFLYYSLGYIVYKILPFIELSQLEHTSNLPYFQALQALSFVSFLCIHLYFFTCYLFVRRRLFNSIIQSIATALVCLILSLYMYLYSIDALYLFYSTLLLFYLDKTKIFIPLLITSVFINEKIALLFFSFFLANLIFQFKSTKNWGYFLFATLTIGIYIIERLLLRFPGYEYQTDVTQIWDRFIISFPYIFSLKGFYMNILPLAILSSICWSSWKYGFFNNTKPTPYNSKAILIMPFLFFVLGMFTCSDYGIGRVTLHTLPLFIPQLSFLLKKLNGNAPIQHLIVD